MIRRLLKRLLGPALSTRLSRAVTRLSRAVTNVKAPAFYRSRRTGRLATRWLGPVHRRSRDLVEIDITYVCNLACFNCNRSVSQAPSRDHMSLAQIRRFLDDSRASGMHWKRIRLLGGEPTVHPEFLEIVNMLIAYRDVESPDTAIEVSTNGFGRRVRQTLARVPAAVRISNSMKESNIQPHFSTFNVSPRDLPEYQQADFSNGCWITQECGIGVTPYGYYPCAIAGTIDRTFGFDLGRKSLPVATDDMRKELETFCAVCGHFKDYLERGQAPPVTAQVTSATWARAYAAANVNPPALSRLPEARARQATDDRHAVADGVHLVRP